MVVRGDAARLATTAVQQQARGYSMRASSISNRVPVDDAIRSIIQRRRPWPTRQPGFESLLRKPL
jgi:hypothetical protein